MLYYKHYGNMRHDYKIRKLIMKYGVEGYGLYNLIVEIITDSLCTENPIPILHETPCDIESFYGLKKQLVEEMISYMIELELFERDQVSGKVMCQKVYKFFDTSQTKSEPLRAMIKEFKKTHKSYSQSDNPNNSPVSESPERIEKDYKRSNSKKRRISDQSSRDYPHEWGELRTYWNSKAELPEYRKELVNESNAGDIKNLMTPYDFLEMRKAIDNYSDLLDQIKSRKEFQYQTFKGFMEKGLARFFDAANPRDRYDLESELSDEEIEKMKKDGIL